MKDCSRPAAKASGDNYRVIFPNKRPSREHHHPCHSPTTAPVLSVSSLGHKHLIPPTSSIARAVMMGNTTSNNNSGAAHASEAPITGQQQQNQNQNQSHQHQQQKPPMSNLSALLEEGNRQSTTTPSTPLVATAAEDASPCACEQPAAAEEVPLSATFSSSSSKHDEADSASGPPPAQLGRSAPTIITTRRFSGPSLGTPPTSLLQKCSCTPSSVPQQPASLSSSDLPRRCLSSRELESLAPPSGSPYLEMLNQKEELKNKMTERLREKRDNIALEATPSTSPIPETAPIHSLSINNKSADKDVSSSSSSQKSTTTTTTRRRTNEDRNRRRAAHNRAVVEDLCDVVADLFVAESKLINPALYGVSRSLERDQFLKSVQTFVAALPTRYALGADTPSEVLLHMRLMAVARSDPGKCVVHITKLDDNRYWTDDNGKQGENNSQRNLRLVTISCCDSVGLLEYITKLLGTGGSRVLDADVMLSSDRTVLDRFIVEANGRLRLDKLAQLIEAFLKKARDKAEHDRLHKEDCSCQENSQGSQSMGPSGPLYFNLKHHSSNNLVRRDIEEEIQTAVPLTEVLASPNSQIEASLDPHFVALKRHFSVPNELACRSQRGPPATVNHLYTPNLSSSQPSQSIKLSREPANNHGIHLKPRPDEEASNAAIDPAASNVDVEGDNSPSMRQKRPLVNRRGAADLDRIEMEGESVDIDYVTVPSRDAGGAPAESRVVPLIPFDELKLIETVGMGRVSTIYRTAWQNPIRVQMVALKVAMVNPETRDMSHVDELRREADIAARLKHPNVVDLVGVAADAECFCLAYDFCEGGSVLSLLSDTSRYYEYLPIALDVANGMAYLHSRDIIHRDLKPSNVLLTRDHRAKIADFGMSVANAGQELTAETGTYRFMAPEVIRHESYSSNADVYSFGVFLWQLITRQVPFGSMTPVQAAYAVAEGRRPEIPESTPRRLKEIIEACWDQDSHKRPSFTYIAMALADYAKISFSPASVGAQTLQIANDMLATVEGNSNINVDFTTSVPAPMSFPADSMYMNDDDDVGLEI